MSMLGELARKWNYSVHHPGAGRLLYREGNREYTFPVFQEKGVLILVGVPSSQRVHFFFNWHAHEQDFSTAARCRILPRIVEHLRSRGIQVRLFERGMSGADFAFYPELFGYRERVSDLLDDAGFVWSQDYTAIELSHGEYGVEVCGIQNEHHAQVISGLLRRIFPHWHHLNICRQDHSRDPGWAVALSMFAAQACSPGSFEEE